MMQTRYFLGLPMVTFIIGTKPVEAIVDTGFNGAVLLPKQVIKDLHLENIGQAEYTMADGDFSEANIFSAECEWLGKRRKVSVVESDADFSLVGMELLSLGKTILQPAENVLRIEANE